VRVDGEDIVADTGTQPIRYMTRAAYARRYPGVAPLRSGDHPALLSLHVDSLAACQALLAENGVATVRPDLIAPVQMIRKPNQWFSNSVCDPTDPNNCPAGSSFAVPVSFVNGSRVVHFGNLGRNALTGPGFNNVDFSVLKNTRIRETIRTQFRAEIFDIFNHANFGNPGLTATPGSTTFGVIQSTRFPTGESGSSRQMQFTLKVMF